MKKHLTYSCLSIVGAFLALIIIYGCSGLINSFQNQFFERDPALSYYDKNGDQVPGNMLSYITYPISFGMVVIFSLVSTRYDGMEFDYLMKKFIVCFLFTLGLGSAIVANQSVTTIIKRVVGRPRPAAFYMCNYKGYHDAVDSGDYSTYNSLTTANAEGFVSNCYGSYVDAFQSFPSGHASQAFVTLLFATLLLRSLLQVSERNFFSLANMAAFGPVVIASWISLTRITDNKHHADDVIAGVIIGSVCALLAYWTVDDWLMAAAEKTTEDTNSPGGNPKKQQDVDSNRGMTITREGNV